MVESMETGKNNSVKNVEECVQARLMEAYETFRPNQRGGMRILVGVSGGADSVTLLLALSRLQKQYWDNEKKLQIFALHLNHMIRVTEAVRDEVFTTDLCKRLEVPCFVERVDIRKMSEEQGMTLEEAGRIKRYELLEQYRVKLNCDFIATAHHMDDNVETIFLNYLRGCGLRGLSGMRTVSMERHLLRPMLDLEKTDILAWLEAQGQDHVTDSTNFENDAARNRVRNVLLPGIEKCGFRDLKDHVMATASLCAEADDYMEAEASKLLMGMDLKRTPTGAIEVPDCSPIYQAHPAVGKYAIRRILRESMRQSLKDLTLEHIEQIRALAAPDRRVGAMICLPDGGRVRRTYTGLIFYRDQAEESDTILKATLLANAEGSTEAAADAPKEVQYDLELTEMTETEMKERILGNHEENACVCYVDYDKIVGGLTVRYRQAGDFIALYKDGKGKLLKDYFIDRKVLKEDRDRIPLVVMGRRDVLWIAPQGDLAEAKIGRVAENCKIDDDTVRYLQVRLVVR